jgi:GntP family gluconate:H+ symporter
LPEQLVSPWFILAAGIATVVGLIVLLRVNAFLALLTAALVVSLLAPGSTSEKTARVAAALGDAAARIAIVIALASVIGKCMMDSGAADRIVRAFLSALGEKRAATALVASGYVLSIPVFFDTVFYLLLPLARSMTRRTGRHYVKFLLAIAAGGAATHTMVPPTPGPLAAAANLHVDLGVMILVGILVSLPASVVGLLVAGRIDRRLNIELRPLPGGQTEPEPLPDDRLPPLVPSLLPIVLPVALISASTIVSALATRGVAVAPWLAGSAALAGDANSALFVSAIVAMTLLWRQRRTTRDAMAALVEESLTSAGVIILITAAGGAFGAMLRAANVGPAVEALFPAAGARAGGVTILLLGAGMSVLFKVAQGSSTVAILTASAMIAAMVPNGPAAFHPVYLALAISAASLVGTWMNDSGFWIISKMGGLTEAETLRTWTILSASVGITGVVVTTLLALVFPMRAGLP